MKALWSLILLSLFAPVAHAADANSPFQATWTLTFTTQPKLTLTGMLDNSLGGRWDSRTQTLRLVDRFGIGTEKSFLPDARAIIGGKLNLSNNNTALLLLGQRNNDPTTKPRDISGNPVGGREFVIIVAWRKTLWSH
ncbi:MAG: hypothetical protein RLZZ26_37 [Candidatus Parcubacteria bacterium]|jgi:hypothetical protein